MKYYAPNDTLFLHKNRGCDKVDKAATSRILKILPLLNEKQKRLYLAAEAESIGHGGVKAIHELTKVSQTTIIQGKRDLRSNTAIESNRIRKCGGGRKPVVTKQENIKQEIETLLTNKTYGNPENPIFWTTKSLRNIAEILMEKGYKISHDTVGNILKDMGYSLQS